MNTENIEPCDNPTPTYRGYRKQALYCLHQTLHNESYSIVPEGKEDFEIRDSDNNTIEIIQVKDLKNNLVLSDFDNTIIRSKDHLNTKCIISIAHYGELGVELKGIKKKTKTIILNKLTGKNGKNKYSYTETEAENFINQVQFIKLSEADLHKDISEKLSKMTPSGDPEVAFELLSYWIYVSSEKQELITIQSLKEKLSSIGKYIGGKIANDIEWDKSIIPLFDDSPEITNTDKFQEEFNRGIETKPEHIICKCDMIRNELLSNIDHAFKETNVVVIRGASGQGKTTLALRYIYDYCPKSFRFLIKRPQDIVHVRNIALAISEHSKVIEIPLTIFIDVTPSTSEWTELIRELHNIENIQILVSVREEDIKRNPLPDKTELDITYITMKFEESDAEAIYNELLQSNQEIAASFTSFSDAWDKFDSKHSDKPLLEFMYFLTHTEMLYERLNTQVQNIKIDVSQGKLNDKTLELLQVIAIATTNDNRLKLSKIKDFYNKSVVSTSIDRFTDEYLIRKTDDDYIVGLHAVRSNVISEIIHDPSIYPWIDAAKVSLKCLPDEEIESFLIYSFTKHEAVKDEIIEEATKQRYSNWLAINGVARSVLYIGIKEYCDENKDLFDELKNKHGDGWWLYCNLNFDNNPQDPHKGLQKLLISNNPDIKNDIDKYENTQTPTSNAFNRLRIFSKTLTYPMNFPQNASEHLAKAECLYNLTHYRLLSKELLPPFDSKELTDAISLLPPRLLSGYMISVRVFDNDYYLQWLEKNYNLISKYLFSQAGFLAINNTTDEINGIFQVPFNFSENKDYSTEINNIAVEKVEVLGALLSKEQKTCVRGFGHNSMAIDPEHDPSKKDFEYETIKNARVDYVRVTFQHLSEFNDRPENWNEYWKHITATLNHEKYLVNSLYDTISNYLKKSNSLPKSISIPQKEQFNNSVEQIRQIPKLPQCATHLQDYYNSFRPEYHLNEMKIEHDEFVKCINEYTQSFTNFIRQADILIAFISGVRCVPVNMRGSQIELAYANGVPENISELIIHNLRDSRYNLSKLLVELVIFKDSLIYNDIKDNLESLLNIINKTLPVCCDLTSTKFKDKAKRNILSKFMKKNKQIISKQLKERFSISLRDIEWESKPSLLISINLESPVEYLNVIYEALTIVHSVFDKNLSNLQV